MNYFVSASATRPIIFYTSADCKVTVDVRFASENFWLTQKTMAELFGVQTPAVNKHLKNIFASGELVEGAVLSILETTAADGKSYATRFHKHFLDFTDQQVLEHTGKISQEVARAKAHGEYEKFRVQQDLDYQSDFDLRLMRYLKGEEKP